MPASRVVLREVRRFAAAARPSATDRDLLGRFAADRDGPAFAELVRRHGPMVLGVCRRVLAHAADADDAFQAAFLVLVRKAHAVADPDRLGPWLFGVAWRTAHKVRTARRPCAPLPDDLPDRRPEAADWPVELDAAIARLPEKYRAPVVLCHLQGLTLTEAAGRLGCPPSTVATRLARARAAVRKRLAARGLAVPAGLVAGAALHLPPALTAAVTAVAAGRISPTPAARLAAAASWSLSMTQFRTLAASALVVVLSGVGLYGLRAGGQGLTAPPPTIAPPTLPPPEAPEPGPMPPRVKVTSDNFDVEAPSTRIGRLIADAAERARKEFAVAWLGKELPKWAKPVPIKAALRADGPLGAATTFNFEGGGFRAEMTAEGSLDRLLADAIPHEVTHCVLADHFRKPLNRWADEGIGLMSESVEEQGRHATIFFQMIGAGRLLQTRALFNAKEYPADVMVLYAQGLHVTKFLVGKKDRPTFVAFVKDGMAGDWEGAAKKHYGFASLDDLEAAYLSAAYLKAVRPGAAAPDYDPAPRLALATLNRDGQTTVTLPGAAVVPMTSYRERSVADPATGKPRNYLEPVTDWRLVEALAPRVFEAGRVRALTLDGKPADAAAVRAALGGGKPVPVVVTHKADGIDPAFGAALKPGTLVLVLPAEEPAAPPRVPPPGVRP